MLCLYSCDLVPSPRRALIYTSTMVQFIQCTVHFHHILPEDNRAERSWNGCFTEAFPSPFHLQRVTLRGWFPFVSRKITLFPSLPHASMSTSWELLMWNLLTQVITNTETAKNLIRFLYFIIICATLISFWFDIFLYSSNEFNYPALIKVWMDCFMSSGNKDLVFRIEKNQTKGELSDI